MFLTLIYDSNGAEVPITFDGTPAEVQAEANGFIAGELTITRIIVMGEK